MLSPCETCVLRSRPLIAFGGQAAAVVALLGFWGLISTAAPVGWWA
jgi:hypothetical protein